MKIRTGHMGAALLLTLFASLPGRAQQIGGPAESVRAVQAGGLYCGFDVQAGPHTVAVVRFSSRRLLTARQCRVGADHRSLAFSGWAAPAATGLRLGARDSVTVTLSPHDPYPTVAFSLTVAAFDPARWRAAVGPQPFHVLTLSLPEAEAWHQGGWLNATPRADPFPLLGDVHIGTPELSAYKYNRRWSYTPPLSAHAIPVIGLWAPGVRRYVGWEFQTARLSDNSERNIATGYCWVPPAGHGAGEDAGQFVALVAPYGGPGYQSLTFPPPGTRLASHARLLWSRNLPATDDPNRLFWDDLWARHRDALPRVPATADVGWEPGGIRQKDFAAPPGGSLIGGGESTFWEPGTTDIEGWAWHNESPTAPPTAQGDAARLRALQADADRLLPYAKHFIAGGEPCVFWTKPLTGQWKPEWGGAGVATLHNANGFAAGRLFLGLYRDAGRRDYLPVVDGVLNWARHIAWTRNEFPDVPSSPFAIGGTLSAAFCLDYYDTFRGAPDAMHRQRARAALALARSFTYRYMVLWPSDNDRTDGLDSSFLWEPNSGRDWTGAACANEVFWNLDTLAQTAVQTGDPVLMWALQGSLSRWNQLYQDVYKDSLTDYVASDMAEGFGLAPGNVYGLGQHSTYGFANPLVLMEPVGDSAVRILAGERAALAFDKNGGPFGLRDYRRGASGTFAFTLSGPRTPFDVSLTAPYTNLSRRPVRLVRAGRLIPLVPGRDFVRPPQALWSLSLKNLSGGDRVIVGEADPRGPVLPSTPPLTYGAARGLAPATGRAKSVPLPFDTTPDTRWDHPDSWAGLPRGTNWALGVPYFLAPPGGPALLRRPARLPHPLRHARLVMALYSAGEGPPPALVLSDGTRVTVDAKQESLAWQAWPPLMTARLVLAPIRTGGKTVVGVDPGTRSLWALTAYPDAPPAVLARLRGAASQWRRVRQEEAADAALTREMSDVPRDSFALLPPSPTSPAANLLRRVGLSRRGALLTPEQLVDPAVFNARRLRAVVYADGEDYVDTVRTPGDASDALVRYVQEGGTLLLLGQGPWPLFYATGGGPARPAPLTPRLGLPLQNALETDPTEPLRVELSPGSPVLPGLPAAFPFPPGDPRLRSIDRTHLPPGASYRSIYNVRGAGGKDYGDAGGLIFLPGGGRILYLWGGLLRDPAQGPIITRAALRFLHDVTTGR